jgi:UDP-N-acetyl-D-mannosaminuronic acid dehydrogenase
MSQNPASNVCIVGCGYVGLTLGVVLADHGFKVYGVEKNPELVKQLNAGNPHFHEKGLQQMLKKHLGKNITFSDKMPKEKQEIFVISVGTPINLKEKRTIMDPVVSAAEMVLPHLHDDALVILRSTVPVGTTAKVVKPILDKSGKKYMLAMCPERTAEGKALEELVELPQIIGGIDTRSVQKSTEFFKRITPTTTQVSSLEEAEMIKLINNAYRDLTFAFANEIALISEKFGLDATKTIRNANLGYARSNVPTPGFVGGACLEKDPHILIESSTRLGFEPQIIKHGRELNEHMTEHVAGRIDEKLSKAGKDKAKAKIFVMGFAFKGNPETSDTRGSLTIPLIEALKGKGYRNFYGQDFVVANDEIKKFGAAPAEGVEEGFKGADCVVIANNHAKYKSLDVEHLIATMNKPAVFFDCWHIFEPREIKRKEIIYGGIGVD